MGDPMRYLLAYIVFVVAFLGIIKYDRWKHGPL